MTDACKQNLRYAELGEADILNPIKDMAYLRELILRGYSLKGPRLDQSRDLLVFERFLNRGHDFFPENWLKNRGYKFVEPSIYTKYYKLAYNEKEGVVEQYFKSNYTLYNEDKKIHLYFRER